MNVIKDFVYQIIKEEFSFPKNKWILLKDNDPRKKQIEDDLLAIIDRTYKDIGGHFNIKSTKDLYKNRYWLVNDIDADNKVDVAMLAKDNFGAKISTAANDGSQEASKAYKEKALKVRSGESVNGVGNWWGEVSGKPAYALLSRGAPALEDESTVRRILAGDDIIWYGEHPDQDAPEVFKKVSGWYGKKFGDHSSIKIIIGKPK